MTYPPQRPLPLYACLYAREFPRQAMLRLRPQLKREPVVILEGTPPRQWVCSLNTHARTLGIDAGLTRAELDVFPGVTLLPRSLSEEASARGALLQCAAQFSPRIENLSLECLVEGNGAECLTASDAASDTHFCCILDIAGTEKLLGPPEKLAQRLLHSVRTLGIEVSVVVSANIDAAVCLARGLPESPLSPIVARGGGSMPFRVAVIPTGQEATTLAPLPLAVLPLTTDHAETFARWGITTLGALAALPEKELISRLGQQGRRLRQLALGEAPHLLLPADPPLTLEERIELDSPVELLDSLLFVLGVLLDHLIARALAQILALASVTVTLTLEGGSTHIRTVRPALPGNDRRLWLRLLHLDLQAHPPFAPILSLTVTADPGSTSKVQLGLFSPQLPEPDRLDVTLARIRAILGPCLGPDSADFRVGRAVLEDSHRPDAFRVEPFTIPVNTPANKPTPIPQAHARSARRRLRPPEPIAVTLHQRRPASLVFRNRRYTVERAWGPWFFSGNWWGIECWSIEKWDVVARANESARANSFARTNDAACSSAILSCSIARNPLRRANAAADWRLEELYD